MKNVKNRKLPEVGELALLTRWCDAEAGDPWEVGMVLEVRKYSTGNTFYKIRDREYKNAVKITENECKELMRHSATLEAGNCSLLKFLNTL